MHQYARIGMDGNCHTGTFGGVIEIDGDCFGMTVHHLLDPLLLGLESESESNELASSIDGLWEEEALPLPVETVDDVGCHSHQK